MPKLGSAIHIPSQCLRGKLPSQHSPERFQRVEISLSCMIFMGAKDLNSIANICFADT